MKVKTEISTTHNLTLDPEEWFTIRMAGDRVLSVDSLTLTQHGKDEDWEIKLYGSRVRKDGSFGARQRGVSTWEHSRSFSDAARRALWAALPEELQANLADMGVKP